MFENLSNVIDRLAVAVLLVLGSEFTQLGAYGLLTLPDQLLHHLRNLGTLTGATSSLVNSIGVPYATGATLAAAAAAWIIRDLRRERVVGVRR